MPDPDGRRVNVLISGMKCPQCATIQKPDALQGDSGFFVEHMKAESLSRPHTIDQRGSDGDKLCSAFALGLPLSAPQNDSRNTEHNQAKPQYGMARVAGRRQLFLYGEGS